MDSQIHNDFCILLLSCDKHADVWPVTLGQFRKYFRNNGYPVYFGSNQTAPDDPDVIPVLSGLDRDWSSSYTRILEQIPCRKLFVLLEDLVVASPIDPGEFNECVRFMLACDAMHIKYWSAPKPDKPTAHEFFWEYGRGAPYRATVCGFWDREYLLRLLLPGESPWNFEIMGSYRTSYHDGFYTTARPLFQSINIIEKGSWVPESLGWAARNNICFDLSRRPTLAGRKGLVSRLQAMYFSQMLKVPWRIRLGLMNKLRKGLISY